MRVYKLKKDVKKALKNGGLKASHRDWFKLVLLSLEKSVNFFVEDVKSFASNVDLTDTVKLPYKNTLIAFNELIPGLSDEFIFLLEETSDVEIRGCICFRSEYGIFPGHKFRLVSVGNSTKHQHFFDKEAEFLFKQHEKIWDEAVNIITAILINLSNNEIEYEDSKPGAQSNEKRKAKPNALPLYSFKTIKLKKTPLTKNTNNKISEIERVSPRAHLRRGHFRNSPTKGKIWIKPCAVGEKKNGIINKDYLLH